MPLAAARATIDALIAEDLPGNAARMGERLIAGLRELQRQYPVIGDVRGLGLMIGVEFAGEAGVAKRVQQVCLAENLLLLTCGVNDQVVRWIPPLVVGEAEIDAALAVFRRALAANAAPAAAEQRGASAVAGAVSSGGRGSADERYQARHSRSRPEEPRHRGPP